MSHETNFSEEQQLGHLIRQKLPDAKNPYEAVKRAYEQLYPQGDLQAFKPSHADDAFGEVQPTGPRSFNVLVNEQDMEKQPLPAGINRDDWETGVLAHEALGHGGDQARNPWLWNDASQQNESKGRHFMRSPYASVGDDSIDWLINDTKARLKTDQDIQQSRAAELAQAKALGLPTELPENVKGTWPDPDRALRGFP